MRTGRILGALVLGWALTIGPLSQPAQACPMCRVANEASQDDNRPLAYMYSILFMLAVPAALATGFGIGFYRLSRQRDEAWSEGLGEPADPHLDDSSHHPAGDS